MSGAVMLREDSTVPDLSAGWSITAETAGTLEGQQQKAYDSAVLTFPRRTRDRVTSSFLNIPMIVREPAK